MQKELLSIENLRLSFSQYPPGFSLRRRELHVIHDLSLTINEGEMVAVVGSSGSGKSLLAHALLGILPANARMQGRVIYDGRALTNERIQALRGREIALIPQGVSYLDPLMKVEKNVLKGAKGQAEREKLNQIFARYSLPLGTGNKYPFELSGGMARRVLLSTAMLESPRLIIADEPTPGLHKQAAQRVLSHLREFADAGCAVLLITHDLDLAISSCDRIAVFYAGHTLEDAKAGDFKRADTLRHPYSRALLTAMPGGEFKALPGAQPYADRLPDGCVFYDRCPNKSDACKVPIPYRSLREGLVRCILSQGEVAPT